ALNHLTEPFAIPVTFCVVLHRSHDAIAVPREAVPRRSGWRIGACRTACRGTVVGLSCWTCITATPPFCHDRGPVHTASAPSGSRSRNELGSQAPHGGVAGARRSTDEAQSVGGSSGEPPS